MNDTEKAQWLTDRLLLREAQLEGVELQRADAAVRADVLAIAYEEATDALRDMAHAMGAHARGCRTCRHVLKRHAVILAPLLREPVTAR